MTRLFNPNVLPGGKTSVTDVLFYFVIKRITITNSIKAI